MKVKIKTSKGNMVAELFNDATPKTVANFIKLNAALLRMPTALEVGQMCVFLASEKASAITGQCINVDCGVLPQ